MLPGASHRLIFSLHSSLEDSRFMHVTVSVSVRNCVQELVLHQCLVTNFVAVEQQHPHSFSQKAGLADHCRRLLGILERINEFLLVENRNEPWTSMDHT